jgi:hypothetical protein
MTVPAATGIVFVPIKDKLAIITYWVTTAKEKGTPGGSGQDR